MKKPVNVYRQFFLAHQENAYTYHWFVQALDHLWDYLETKGPKMIDWLGYEQFTRDVLGARLDDSQKLALLKAAVGAFTGRGAVEQ